MVLQNSEDQSFSNNADGWALGGGSTVRTLTLSGADFPLLLSSPASGNILQFNGTNWINTAGSTFGTGSVTNIATGSGLTGGPITQTGTIAIAANGVTSALFRQSAASTIVGNSGTALGNVSDISIGSGLALGTNGTLAIGTSGVTAGTYAFSTVVVNALGQVTSATAGTPVTNIATGTGLTGGPITSTGTIAMGTSGVTAGTYGAGTAFPSIVVDSLGRVLSATTVALGSIASQGSNNVTITGGTITGLPTPVNASDAATKSYVDNVTAGLTAKAEINWATTGTNLAATYNNGVSGVGATLTLTATGALVIDGGTVALNDRILVKDQIAPAQNGIYVVTTAGTTGVSAVLTRSTDFNSSSTVFDGAYAVIGQGSINKGTLWILTNTGDTTYTIGTTAINFTELTVANQSLTFTGDVTGAGAGTVALTLATVNSNVGTFGGSSIVPVITVNGKGLITSVGTAITGTGSVTSVSVTGANGIGVAGSPITNTGTIALTLGAITPTSVASTGAVSGTALNSSGTINATGNLTAANFTGSSSGTNTGDQTITLTGDVTGSGTGSFATTLATVNSNIGTFTTHVVNAKGLVTAAGNLVATGDVTGTASGTSIALTLGTSGVTAGTYGNTTNIPQIIVNAKGLVTSVTNTSITYGTGSVTNIATGTGLTGGPITNAGTISMGTSGVTAGTYAFATVSVDALGRVLTATAGTPVTSIVTGTGLTGGTITSTGTVAMGTSGVTAGTYGNATQTSIITVDALGRVTSASTGTTTLGTGSVTSIIAGTGLTGGTINGTGTIAIGTTGVTPGTYSQVVVNALGQVTSGTSDNLSWVSIVGTSQPALTNTGYIPNNASITTITLPSTANVGDIVPVVGKGSGGWKVAQNAGQTIHFGNKNTTTGTAGSLASNNQYHCVELICVTANTDFVVRSSVGNITIS